MGNRPNKAKELSEEEEEKLWEKGALGLDTPDKLISTV
jgi:hypothetical protein